MFFETAAYAQQAGAAAPQGAMGGLMSFMPIILMVLIFYFSMIDALKAGDTVLTNAGIIGTISSVDGNIMVVDLGGTKVRMIKGYIADKIDPNTLNTVTEAVKEK